MNNRITAIYCRIAHPCAPDDIAAVLQKESLVRYAKEHGYENIECYEDIGFNGLSFSGRPAFRKLQGDIDAGRVQKVIVKNESRVGRNAAEVIRWISGLQAKGVEFIATAHPVLTVDVQQKLYGAESEAAVNG